MSKNPALASAQCAVIGNPIAHSRSPDIHQQFAQQTGVDLSYRKVKLETAQLSSFIKKFFQQGGVGLNVTTPFKCVVIENVDRLTEAATTCQSVNTIYKDSDGLIVGDTTDGAGIVMDLERLQFIQAGQKIAIVGAGGASVSVALALLNQKCSVYIVNRTKPKIDKLVLQLKAFGTISALESHAEIELDGIISATSEFNQAFLENALKSLKPGGFVYDLNYTERAKSLLDYCQNIGINRVSDGYGMLLGQAAKSFEIWHRKLPLIDINSFY